MLVLKEETVSTKGPGPSKIQLINLGHFCCINFSDFSPRRGTFRCPSRAKAPGQTWKRLDFLGRNAFPFRIRARWKFLQWLINGVITCNPHINGLINGVTGDISPYLQGVLTPFRTRKTPTLVGSIRTFTRHHGSQRGPR